LLLRIWFLKLQIKTDLQYSFQSFEMDMGGRLKPSYKFLEPFLGDFEPGYVVCVSIGWFTSSTVILCVYIQYWFNIQHVSWIDGIVLTALGSDLILCTYIKQIGLTYFAIHRIIKFKYNIIYIVYTILCVSRILIYFSEYLKCILLIIVLDYSCNNVLCIIKN